MNKLIIAAAALVAMTVGVQAQTLRIGTEGAYAPWNFVDDAGNLAGFEIDLGNEICKRAGLECEFIQTAWDTMIPNLNAGNYDAIMAGMSITEERKQSIDFTQDYKPPTPSTYIMTTGASFELDNPQGLRIGTQTGTIQAAYAEENLKAGNTLLSFDTADQALADLGAGNLDVILGDKDYLAEAAAGSGGALTLGGPEIPIGDGVGVGLRKQDDDLEKKLNDAISAAKADGTLDALIVKWFPEQGPGPYYAN